ncbi:MAG: TonB-dependent receptor domain-containing protein [Longimicrobiaceae bacterium]
MYRHWLARGTGPLLVLCLSLLTAPAAWTQDAPYTIQGTVVDAATQRPLPNVAVQIRGTQQGTLTDNGGRYTIIARVQPGAHTLQYSMIGRGQQTRAVTLGAERTVRIEPVTLQETAVQLEEIVVTGTGAPTQRRALGNAVSTVSGENVTASSAVTVDAALAGKVPGAQIMSNSGTPGGGVSVRLRGTSSIIGGAEPLYIVDGVIVDNSADQPINFGYRSNPSNRLADLNPNDIERIEVLKGAAAAALYGSRANNGVIQIFTKRGAAGQPRITAESRLSLGQLPKRLPFNMFPFDTVGGQPVQRFDHQDLIFQDALSNDSYISVSGGADQTQFYLSAGYTQQNGIMRGSDHEKINARLNVDQTLWGVLRLSGGANYINSHTNLLINGEQGTGGILTAIVFTPTNIDFSARDPQSGQFLVRQTTFPNPLEVIERWSAPQEISRFVGSFQARATPGPATLEYRLGYDTYNMSTGLFIPRGTPVAVTGSSTAVTRTQYLINNDLVGSYQLQASPALQLTSTLGMNHTFSQEENVTAAASDLVPVTRLVRGAVQSASQNRFETATLGVFGQQQVGLADRLFLTGALRYDASSTFGADERWQLYPKLSASYVISQEPVWQNSPMGGWLGEFRIRGALGYAGNQPPVASAYARFPRYRQEINVTRSGLVHLANPGNPNLKPERQREYEVGFDASALGDRFGLAFTYYNQYISDLLLTRPFAPSTGYGSVLDNVGELSNRGVELQLTSRNVDQPRFGWSSTLNFSANRNRVERLAGAPFTEGYFNRVEEGQPLGVWFLRDFERDEQGAIRLDAAGLPVVGPAAIVGDPNPDWQASLMNEFRLGRNLSASFLLDGVFGHDVWNQTMRIMDRFAAGPLYERQLRGEITNAYRLRYFTATAAYLEDGSFIKLREAALRYTLTDGPVQRLGLASAQVELAGRNLFTWTDYSGYDPEVNMFGTATVARGTDFAVYPNPRQISLGLRLSY